MHKSTINIDIVSDIVCPWCAIGYGRLKKAIANLAEQNVTQQVEFNIQWHPFELNPNMSEQGENLREHLAKKYGTTLEGSIKARAMLTEEGKKVGFTFNYFDQMKMLNTHQCHQLLHWSKNSGQQNALAEGFFAHFFTNRGEFSEAELLAIVNNVGLSQQQAAIILSNNTMSQEVRRIEAQWQQKGIHSVPLFIFNNDQALSGAQEVSTFERLLRQSIKNI